MIIHVDVTQPPKIDVVKTQIQVIKLHIITDSFNFEYLFDSVLAAIESKYVVIGGLQLDIGGGEFGGKNSDDEGVDDT